MLRPDYRGYRLSRFTHDPYLNSYADAIRRRRIMARDTERRITGGSMDLLSFASGHEYYGLHFRNGEWILREWAPNVERAFLVGPFSDWKESQKFEMRLLDKAGNWEIILPADALKHGDLYKLHFHWQGGHGERIPAYARRVVQDDNTKIFSAQVWNPEKPYAWKHTSPKRGAEPPVIYEAHVGLAQERPGIGTYSEFRRNMIPRIVNAGYNTIQLMAILEHPYYGSFGYHVSSFFAASSRFGTPEELMHLIDTAHGRGLAVIIDIVHSHAVNNEVEGLSRFDGTLYQYFHDGPRGRHDAWDSRCFDYGKNEVLHFLLSNCRYWLDAYHVDGFRFDGVTSMLYHHHGLGPAFDHYDRYFDGSVDEDAIVYLTLANRVIHTVNPSAITIAEDVSGMPGLAAPLDDGGCGFDYRMAMGVPDAWFKLVNDIRDEDWNMFYLWHELTNRRGDELTINYAESHDQALVGGKTLVFEMIDKDMYWSMRKSDQNLLIDRGLALHKIIRLATLATAGGGYLNFIGNEFGHPEWVDFPREGNNWSYHYARRQWSLRDNQDLKYHFFADFDHEMLALAKEYHILEKELACKLAVNDGDKVIVFKRGELIFFFNFHPSRSYTDYAIEVRPGEYRLALDTDAARFGGHCRLTQDQRFITQPMMDGNVLKHLVRVYLPCRTAIVLAPLESDKSNVLDQETVL